MSELKLPAKWTEDCQGKKDYDGRILSVSTRYWPAGGGYHILDSQGFRPSDDGCKPSAESALVIWSVDGDYIDLISKNFEGDTFELVKTQVEEWAQHEYERVISILRAAYSPQDAKA